MYKSLVKVFFFWLNSLSSKPLQSLNFLFNINVIAFIPVFHTFPNHGTNNRYSSNESKHFNQQWIENGFLDHAVFSRCNFCFQFDLFFQLLYFFHELYHLWLASMQGTPLPSCPIQPYSL